MFIALPETTLNLLLRRIAAILNAIRIRLDITNFIAIATADGISIGISLYDIATSIKSLRRSS
jgi:hypothetical protein